MLLCGVLLYGREKRGTMEEQEEKKQMDPIKKKRLFVAVIWGVVLLMLAGILLYGLYQWMLRPGKRYDDYEVIAERERGDGVDTRYLQYGDRILKYNRDGVSVIDGQGTIHWTASYNMKNPTVSMAGDYVAVADVGSRQLYVYDAKGSAEELEILSEILQISVSEQGEVAVLMQSAGRNQIQIWDPYASGERLKAEIGTYVQEDGYAVAVALSRDGAKLVTSYFKMEGSRLISNLTFYNFSGVGQGAGADRIVGIYPYEEVLFAELRFVDDHTIVAYGDDRIEVFDMPQKPVRIWGQEYSQELHWIEGNEDQVVVVTDAGEGNSREVLRMYDMEGTLVTEQELDFECRGIGIRGEDAWAYSGQECLIVRPDNKIRYKGELKESIQYMLAGREAEQFFLINGYYIEEIHLCEKESEE